MRRNIWVGMSVLTMIATITSIPVQAQQGRVTPTGEFVLFLRNVDRPMRFVEVDGGRGTRERLRAHINYEEETIEFSLIMRASNGNYYTIDGPTDYSPRQGWVVAYFNISPHEYARLHEIRVRDYIRHLSPRERVPVEITWYRFEKSRVDRETTKTPTTVSPPPNQEINGRRFIRYYLVDIVREPTRGSTMRKRLSTGGILAPIIHIRWNYFGNEWQDSWIGAPLPGMNDCTRRDRSGNCTAEQTQPTDATYNQHYGDGRRWWRYEFTFQVNEHNRNYFMAYPVYIFQNIGKRYYSRPGYEGHSDNGLYNDNIQYGSKRWFRVHRATIWEGVPYEWGGKIYGARASGRVYGYNQNGIGTMLGFGLDCSGLVAVAKGDYGNANYGTSDVVSETVWLGETDRRTGRPIHYWSRLRPGDVIYKPGHVMLVIHLIPPDRRGVNVIEAVGIVGDPNNNEERVRYYGYDFSDLQRLGYQPRAFRD